MNHYSNTPSYYVLLMQRSLKAKAERRYIFARNWKTKADRRLYVQEKVVRNVELYDVFENHRNRRESRF